MTAPVTPELLAEARRALGRQLADRREAAGLTQAGLARLTGYARSAIANVETGRSTQPRNSWRRYDELLGAEGVLLAASDHYTVLAGRYRQQAAAERERQRTEKIDQWRSAHTAPPAGSADGSSLVSGGPTSRDRRVEDGRDQGQPPPGDHGTLAEAAHGDDALEALELSRRVAASDVGEETLTRLERAVDELAMAYATSRPDELLQRVRRHLGYVGQLIDVRATLRQRRRLVTAAGWLSLLAATAHVDLRQSAAMRARLRTTAELAEQADHVELRAWCLETGAWDALTRGEFRQAVDLSRQAQTLAPTGSSAHIQATAQEGRAWARMRQPTETREVLDRMSRLTSSLAVPDQPEHHYVYDPDKALSYTATTLAWAGDPSAEQYARALIEQLENPGAGPARPRRVATARLDLALSLLAGGKADEAAAVASEAIASRRVVASTWWRAHEIVAEIERLGIKEAAQLRDAYETYRPH